MSSSSLSDIESASIKKRLASAAFIVFMATAVSRIFGYIREIAAAYYFGAGAEKSAFDVAFLVPSTLQILVAQAALSAALIPVFAGLLEKDERDEAWKVARTIFTLVTLVLGAIVLICMVFAPKIMPVFAPGYRNDAGMMVDIVNMSRILFPTVLILSITGIVAAILNSFEHFTLPAVAPIFWNLIIIIVLVLGAGHLGINALAWGVLLGTFVQFFMQLPWLRGRGGRLGFNLAWRNPNVKRVGLLMLPVSLSLGLINLNNIVDVQFASFLGTAGVASMNFAFRLYQLPEALFAVAVGTVLFPTLSKLVARDDIDGFRTAVTSGLRVIFFILIPVSAVILVLAEPIVRLAYQHGQFSAEDTSLVASVLFFFAFGSAFSGGSALLTRGFFSLGKPWAPTMLALANIAVNALLNWIFIKPFDLGGIPLSTSVVSLLTFIALLILIRKEIVRINGRLIFRSVIYVILMSVVTAAVSYLCWRAIDSQLGGDNLSQIISLSGAFLAAAAIYLSMAVIGGMQEIEIFKMLLRQKVK